LNIDELWIEETTLKIQRSKYSEKSDRKLRMDIIEEEQELQEEIHAKGMENIDGKT